MPLRSWSGKILLCAALGSLCSVQARSQDAAAGPHVASVGVPVSLRELVLPGSALEVADSDVTTPIVVRIASVSPHGTAFRYDLVWYGLEPGAYDLREFLRRSDGSSTEDLPPLLIEVQSVLPPGNVQPNGLDGGVAPAVGGYRRLLWIGGISWALVLVGILAYGRRRGPAEVQTPGSRRTLADRLRPLVERAGSGSLARAERAELELLLIAFWRKKLGLKDVGAAQALVVLRDDPQAGALLRALEGWLHRPGPSPDVDLVALLEPYAELEADALDPRREGEGR